MRVWIVATEKIATFLHEDQEDHLNPTGLPDQKLWERLGAFLEPHALQTIWCILFQPSSVKHISQEMWRVSNPTNDWWWHILVALKSLLSHSIRLNLRWMCWVERFWVRDWPPLRERLWLFLCLDNLLSLPAFSSWVSSTKHLTLRHLIEYVLSKRSSTQMIYPSTKMFQFFIICLFYMKVSNIKKHMVTNFCLGLSETQLSNLTEMWGPSDFLQQHMRSNAF